MLAGLRDQGAAAGGSPVASLKATMFGTSRNRRSNTSWLTRLPVRTRHVVDHHRQVGGRRRGAKVRLDAGLRRPVVVGRHEQHARRAQAARLSLSGRCCAACRCCRCRRGPGSSPPRPRRGSGRSAPSSVKVEASPVVAATTRPSLPRSPASAPAAARRPDRGGPASSNGVTMAREDAAPVPRPANRAPLIATFGRARRSRRSLSRPAHPRSRP